jgi:predicted membrane protein
MVRKNQLVAGLVLIAVGALLLVGELFGVSGWRLLFPLILVGLGIWVLARPRNLGRDYAVTQRLLGDVERSGPWDVRDEEIMSFIGDVDLDFSQATIPMGDTRIRTAGFVQDVTVRIPEGVGLAVQATGVFAEVDLLGQKYETFFGSVSEQLPDYPLADRRIRLEVDGFVLEVKVRRG